MKVGAIRQRHTSGATQTALATEYGVSHRLIFNIIRYLAWKNRVEG